MCFFVLVLKMLLIYFRSLSKSFYQRLPGAILIGAKKSGTSFLRSVLELHTWIAMIHGEVHYFDTAEEITKGIKYYKSRMKPSFPDQVTMEKTPRYWITRTAPDDIKRMNHNVKIILTVREPACRVASDFHHLREKQGVANINFNEFVRSDKEKLNFYLEPSFYDKHFENWLKSFPKKQVFIIRNEDMLIPGKLPQVLRDLENFLEIPREFNVKTTNGKTCVTSAYQDYLRKPRRSLCIPEYGVTNHTCSYDTNYKETLDPLRKMFKPHIERFEELAQRKFNWF